MLALGGRSAEMDVVFGAGNDPALNGETARLVGSETPDATITVGGDYRRPDTWYQPPATLGPGPGALPPLAKGPALDFRDKA